MKFRDELVTRAWISRGIIESNASKNGMPVVMHYKATPNFLESFIELSSLDQFDPKALARVLCLLNRYRKSTREGIIMHNVALALASADDVSLETKIRNIERIFWNSKISFRAKLDLRMNYVSQVFGVSPPQIKRYAAPAAMAASLALLCGGGIKAYSTIPEVKYSPPHYLESGPMPLTIPISNPPSIQQAIQTETTSLEGIVEQTSREIEQVSLSGQSGERVVQIAERYIGRPYAWGAQGPTRFDCSGFVLEVYREAGFPYSEDVGSSRLGEIYSAKRNMVELRLGDAIVFDFSINHAVIFAGYDGSGNGYCIDASGSRGMVSRRQIPNSWWRRYMFHVSPEYNSENRPSDLLAMSTNQQS